MIESYRDLDVWRLGMDVAEASFRVSAAFPDGERFGLTAQLKRAAVSIPANIAEGHARSSTRDYRRFISIALGSLAELETHFLLAQRLGWEGQQQFGDISRKMDMLGRKLRGLQKALDQKLAARLLHAPQPPAPSP